MITDTRIVDMVERANDAQPFCPCGSHTTPVWRDRAIWLECASLHQPRRGRLGRLLAVVGATAHTRDRIVAAPPYSAGPTSRA